MNDMRKDMPQTAETQGAAIGSRLPRLIHWLYRKAEERGHSRHELARHLGITHGELMTYASGARDMVGAKRPTVRTISQYLGLPPVAVWLLAGKLRTADFLMPRGSTQTHSLINKLQCVQDDPVIGALVPPDIFDASDKVKALLGSLYADATTAGIFPAGKLPPLLEGVQQVAEKMEDDDYQADAEHLATGRLQ